MNILKNLLATASLTLLLSACGEQTATSDPNKVFKIQGAFGVNIGEQGRGLPEGYIIDNKAFDFTPQPTHPHFVIYTYSITPNTHTIYGIKTKGAREVAKESCMLQRQELIKETLASLGDTSALKVTEEGNKWKIREDNQREVTIECERSLTPEKLQLVMTYQDTSLSLLAYKEWNKRQKDITLFRP